MNSREILDNMKTMLYRIEEYMKKKLNKPGLGYYNICFDSSGLEFEIGKSLFKYNTIDDIKDHVIIFSNDIYNLDVAFVGTDEDAFIYIDYNELRHDIFDMDDEGFELWLKLR